MLGTGLGNSFAKTVSKKKSLDFVFDSLVNVVQMAPEDLKERGAPTVCQDPLDRLAYLDHLGSVDHPATTACLAHL